MEILKIQVPLDTNEPEPFALVYNEDKSIFAQVPMSEDVLSHFDDGEFKIYVSAKLVKDTIVIAGKLNEWPDW
ncbi:MAG: hypothetical protein ACR2PR_06305 [Pseudohongiellaceae bacterium]